MSENKLISVEPRSGLLGRLEWKFPLFLILVFGALLPSLYWSGYYGISDINLWGKYMCLAMLAIGLDLVWGYTGMLSLCQALFFALGGYAMGMYLAHHGGPEGVVDATGWKIPGCLFVVYPEKVGETEADWLVPWFWKPFWWLRWTVLLGIFIPALVAFFVGFLVFRSRVRGVFFAILTQALTLMAVSVFMVNDLKLGGTNGVANWKRIILGEREQIEFSPKARSGPVDEEVLDAIERLTHSTSDSAARKTALADLVKAGDSRAGAFMESFREGGTFYRWKEQLVLVEKFEPDDDGKQVAFLFDPFLRGELLSEEEDQFIAYQSDLEEVKAPKALLEDVLTAEAQLARDVKAEDAKMLEAVKGVLEKYRLQKRREGTSPAPGGSLELEGDLLVSSPENGVNIDKDYNEIVLFEDGATRVLLKDVVDYKFRGYQLTDDSVKFGLYLLSLVLLISVYLTCRYVVSSRMGRVLVAIRDNEDRLRFSGFKPYQFKVFVFTLSAGIAGLGGMMYAPQHTLFNPHKMAPIESIMVVVWVAVGGRGTLWGAAVGALLVNAIYQYLTTNYAASWPFVQGGLFLGIVLVVPGGVASLLKNSLLSLRSQRGKGDEADVSDDFQGEDAEVAEEEMRKRLDRIAMLRSVTQEVDVGKSLLEVKNITVLFDGFKALDVEEFEVGHRELRVIIGPNGAGKTTLCDVISGKTRPTTGQVIFEGSEITQKPEADIAQLGVGRKFQTPTVYDSLTVHENMTLALPGRQGISLGSRISSSERDSIRSLLDRVRLLDDEHRKVEFLSHGQRQWLEISMLILTGPKLLLVDEPAAGLTDEETVLTAELLLECREEHSIIVIEHDMEFVRLLDSHVTVLNEGKIMAEGSVAEIQADEDVKEAYLGR